MRRAEQDRDAFVPASSFWLRLGALAGAVRLLERFRSGNRIAVALKEREAAEAALRGLLDASAESAFLLDPEGTVLAVNQVGAARLGTRIEDLVGRNVFLALPPAAARLRRERLAAVVASGRGVTYEDSAEATAYSVTLGPIPDAAGTITRIAVFARDLTAERTAKTEVKLQAAALEAAANGIAIADVTGRLVWVNAAFTEITGFTREEAVGRTPRILKSGRQGGAFYRELWETVKAGRVWHGELINRRRDGTIYTEEQTITPVRSDDGTVTHFVAIKQDVTDRERAADALRTSEAHFRSLIENALDVIMVIDEDATVRYASPSVERILGDTPAILVGTNALDRLHPDDFPAIQRLLAAGMRVPGFVASAEYRVRHRDGSWRSFESVGRNLIDDPAVRGIIVNARDITERKRGEEMQKRMQDQLSQSEKLAAMGQLLAGVAHELNNPLSVVIGHTGLLRQTTDAAVAARAAKIGQAAERCGRIVKNFLALARQHEPERQQVSLNQIVREVLELLAYHLRVDDVQVETECSGDVPLLWADPHQLQQVLINLITNAHHAMRGHPRPRRLRIATRPRPSGAGVTLEVEDSGPGIPREVEERLFEPFFTTKPHGEGTGLGLSLCKGIVESHAGTITVEGRPGRGARFIVALPRGRAPAPAPAAEAEAPAAPRAAAVLIVDDEPEVAGILAEMVTREGHRAVTASNGAEALARLGQERFDAVLTDIKMPGLDGIALYREIERREPHLRQRVLFVTGDTLSPATVDFLTSAAAPSLGKPFTTAEVQVALAALLRGGPRPQTPA